jgi:molecular chaperone GrpE
MGKKKNEEATADKATKKKSSRKSEEKVEQLEADLSESKDKYLRLFAEFDNYKKRTIKEKLEMMKSASQDVVAALLPVLDDFDRAKQSADDEKSSEQFSEGVSLVYNKLYSTLKSKGLEKMESTNEVFDPELHEAVTEIPAPNDDLKGKVIDTIEQGYYLNDKIIRHAKVVVGK